jgi:hypothetical protein
MDHWLKSHFLWFWAHLWAPEPAGDCLRWFGSTTWQGQPRVKYQRRPRLLTRLICEEAYGPPPTLKHEAVHDTPNGCIGTRCVNPAHLRWATHSENMMDKPRKVRLRMAHFAARVHSENARKRRNG